MDEQTRIEVAGAAPVLNAETPPAPLAQRSRIGALLAEKKFVALAEILPPKGIDCSREIEGAALLARLGAHGINVYDAPQASARMGGLSLCIQIQQHAGIETILHYACRDRTLLSIQADLLGAASIGLHNILCVTGEPTRLGNYLDATQVFDVDSIGLVNIVHRLNRGLDVGSNAIGVSTNFAIGVAANPGAPDLENELHRFAYKVEAGAEYCITQPVFDLRLLENFLERIRDHRIPVIAGLWPLAGLRNAEYMKNDLRLSMPEEIMLRMAQADTPEAARQEGIRIAQEMLAAVQPYVDGVQVSAPFGNYQAAAEVLAGVLQQGSARSAKE
jgi:methionine synthase / methylenetetrahydrofolate reductase(NADPH)